MARREDFRRRLKFQPPFSVNTILGELMARHAWRLIYRTRPKKLKPSIGITLVSYAGLAVVLTATPPPRDAIADACSDAIAAVKDMSSFNDCLNTCQGGKATDVSNTVQCLPPGCKITLTMSTKSAQAACTLAMCQLPRVILDCPPKTDKTLPPFRPSYLLCPIDSTGAGDQFGTDRIEVGQDKEKKEQSSMFMADIPVPPGKNYVKTMLQGIINDKNDSKSCNNCHKGTDPPTATIMGLEALLSQPISPIGKFGSTELAPFVIDTQDPNLVEMAAAKIKAQNLPIPNGTDGKPIKKQTLSEVCNCVKADNDDGKNIKAAAAMVPNNQGPNPNLNEAILLNLCNALNDYRTKKSCGKDPPDDSGTPMACLGVLGGGKFLSRTNAVSWLSVDLSGNATTESGNSFTFTNFDGGASAFAYLTHTLIDPIVLSSLSGTVSASGDITVTGTGVATVNGVNLDVQLDAASINGIVTFSITDLASGTQLAGGTGESGLAGFELTSTGSDP